MPVRDYRSADRSAVRSICHLTGYMGSPIGWQWRDAESFADVFTRYYTDEEPESLLVAELDGEVVGYLLGCLDSRRTPHPLAVMAPHLLRRGLLVRPGTAGFLWRFLADALVDLAHGDVASPRVVDPRWPAHLHTNLLPHARGRGLGRALMQRWLQRVADAGLPGCHLETVAENHPGIAFFEAMGFERHGPPGPAPGLRSVTGQRHHGQLMVQQL